MSKKRMFSLQIVDTDAFLEMPSSTQNLYFHMCMRADDDGFVNNPKKIMKIVNCSDDDLKILFSKRFILGFESGIIVIKHWRIHNYIAKDRYTETSYTEEKTKLIIKDNGSYSECIQDDAHLLTQVSIDKVSIDKDNKEPNKDVDNIKSIIDLYNNFFNKDCKYVESNYKTIRARLNEGYIKDDFIKVMENKKQDKYFIANPQYYAIQTLFGNKFDKYLNESIKQDDVIYEKNDIQDYINNYGGGINV